MITDIGEMTALTSASPEYVGFDEFVEYQDLWFRDRVGDDKGDHRWMRMNLSGGRHCWVILAAL